MVALSGGVDSSVAALLLSKSGAAIAGMFMKNWEEDDTSGICPAEQDALDVEDVCRQIGLPFHTRNFAAEYWDNVFQNFLAEYQAGRTPNPDVLCNREIKFKTFIEHAEDLGVEKIATGHYARVDYVDGRYRLLRGIDANKDQSYFLHAIGQTALSRTLFPIGELLKSEVRRIAAAAGLTMAAKKDSTGICFIGERRFREFLSRFISAQPGTIETPEGKTIGEHIGVCFYTIGQREGLGIGGRSDALQKPWYVVGKDLQRQVLICAQGSDHPLLFSTRLRAQAPTWIAGERLGGAFRCTAQVRYRQAGQDCWVTVSNDQVLQVHFDQPQRAVTPGQALVLYRNEECLGGATIEVTDAVYGGWKVS